MIVSAAVQKAGSYQGTTFFQVNSAASQPNTTQGCAMGHACSESCA
jgi:hypothetical protein